MERDNTIWIKNSLDRTIGIIDATSYKTERGGFLSINTDPVTYSIDLDAVQMRALAKRLNSVADELEGRTANAA